MESFDFFSILLYRKILLIEVAVLYTIGFICLFIKQPIEFYHKSFIKATKIFGIALLIWSILRMPMCWSDLESRLAIDLWSVVNVSGYYVFIRLIFTSGILVFVPQAKVSVVNVFIIWILLSVILLLTILIDQSLFIMIACWIVKGVAILESVIELYLSLNEQKMLYDERSEICFPKEDMQSIKRCTILIITCLLIACFVIGETTYKQKIMYSVLEVITFSYAFVLFSILSQKVVAAKFSICNQQIIATKNDEETKEITKDIISDEIRHVVLGSEISRINIEKRLNDWIETRGYLKEDINIDTVADLLCTNKTYLSSYINKVYYSNFRSWIADLRIEYAKELLKADKNISVAEVAESIYYTPNGFSTLFKKHTGTTVSEWRQSFNQIS